MAARRDIGSIRRAIPAARFGLPVLILLASLLVHVLVVDAAERRERRRVAAHAAAVAGALETRVGAYGGVLYGVRGLFGASQRVTLGEFHANYDARDIETRYPGVEMVGYADLLRPGAFPRRAAELRRQVGSGGLRYPPFAVHPAPAPGARVAPVTYLEPQAGNRPAFGRDLLSEPIRRTALERALATGVPQATAPVRLAQAPDERMGVLLMLSVGDARKPGRTAGATFAAVRTDELVQRVIPHADRAAGVELYDLGAVGAARRPGLRDGVQTYDDGGRRDGDALRPADAPYGSRTVAFDVMGRRWALFYAPDRRLASADQTLLNWLPVLVGAMLAALVAWLLGASLRTERRAVALAERMTESLRESQNDLARSNAELERYAYVASHDLREPLRTITGFLGLISRRHRDRLDDEGREFVDLAVAGAKRMDALIAELLEYSRTGRGERAPEPTDLEGAWSVAVRNLSAAIAESGAEVTAGPLPIVLADRGEMVQVLQNLLGNAIKYHGDGAPRIHADAVRRGDDWEVSVADDGPGIDPRHHERIFVLLQRLHRNDEVEGTGMGLAICKKIIEHHGGRIWVDSEEGEGARFSFALPAAPNQEGEARSRPDMDVWLPDATRRGALQSAGPA